MHIVASFLVAIVVQYKLRVFLFVCETCLSFNKSKCVWKYDKINQLLSYFQL